MNKFVKAQLEKCRVVRLPAYDESTTYMLIQKTIKAAPVDELLIGGTYHIEVEDYIIKPFEGFDLHTNWNNNIIPTDKNMDVQILQIMGKMIKVQAHGTTDNSYWTGWLPRKSIKSIDKL